MKGQRGFVFRQGHEQVYHRLGGGERGIFFTRNMSEMPGGPLKFAGEETNDIQWEAGPESRTATRRDD